MCSSAAGHRLQPNIFILSVEKESRPVFVPTNPQQGRRFVAESHQRRRLLDPPLFQVSAWPGAEWAGDKHDNRVCIYIKTAAPDDEAGRGLLKGGGGMFRCDVTAGASEWPEITLAWKWMVTIRRW